MKPFNLQLAKEGHPIQTRDGHDARIICFDRKVDKSTKTTIIALVTERNKEQVFWYEEDGRRHLYGSNKDEDYDLVMKTKTMQKYVNVYEDKQNENYNRFVDMKLFDIEEEAIKDGVQRENYIATGSVIWEE